MIDWYVMLQRIDGAALVDASAPYGPYTHENAMERAEQIEGVHGSRYRTRIYRQPWPVSRSVRMADWLGAALMRIAGKGVRPRSELR